MTGPGARRRGRLPGTVTAAFVLSLATGALALFGAASGMSADRAGWVLYGLLWSALWFIGAWGLWRLEAWSRVFVIGLAVFGWLIQAIAFRYFEVISFAIAAAVLLMLPSSRQAFTERGGMGSLPEPGSPQ